jgi:signal transduction histidine kinase
VLPSSWRAYRPPRADVALAAGFLLVGQLVTWAELDEPSVFNGPRAANAVLNALLMGALAWRRRAPLAAVCWAVTVYYLSQAVVQHDVPLLAGFVPLIVLTASAGYACTRRRAALAAGLALAGLVAVTLSTPWLRSVDYFVSNVVFLLAPWLAARGLREREDRAASLGAALASERATQDAALREVVADERVRLARELHDIVAHSVSVMVIQIGAARTALATAPAQATAPLLAAEDVGRQALADLRRLLGVLRAEETHDGDAGDSAPQPPQPGLSQLDALVLQPRAAGLLVDVQVDGEPVPLPAGLDLTAYRIVQEALTNTLKHSGAARATVRLVYENAALQVEVVDDGTRRPVDEGTGHGLVGISERVSLFGGRATVGPLPGRGWRVHAELPLPDRTVHDRHDVALPTT